MGDLSLKSSRHDGRRAQSFVLVLLLSVIACRESHSESPAASELQLGQRSSQNDATRPKAAHTQEEPPLDRRVAATRREDSLVGENLSPTGCQKVEGAKQLLWSFDKHQVGVFLPERCANQPIPVLIVFHGRGEAQRGRDIGARAWFDDYALQKNLDQLILGEVSTELLALRDRAAAINRALKKAAYQPYAIITPSIDDRFRGEQLWESSNQIEVFFEEELLPKLRFSKIWSGQSRDLHVDGVSLGGRLTMALATSKQMRHRVSLFASLQAAFDMKEIPALVQAFRTVEDIPTRLRLLTSDQDYFLDVNRELNKKLTEQKIGHDYLKVPGDHSYEFNRGIGGLEMLIYHDRIFQNLPLP